MAEESGRSYASPPCLAQELDPAWFDPLAVDPEQARDVAACWRRPIKGEPALRPLMAEWHAQGALVTRRWSR